MNRERALILGAGSGRDVATAVLVSELLRGTLPPVDFAGFLTPWAWHYFDGRPECPVNPLKGPGSKLLLDGQNTRKPFFEPVLPAALALAGVEFDAAFALSLQGGTDGLKEPFLDLVQKRGYTHVVAVDVGGDSLAEPEDFAQLLTPIVDFSCIDLLCALPSRIKTTLAVLAPGVCGEVRSGRLLNRLSGLARRGALEGVHHYSASSEAFRRFCMVNDHLDEATGAYSHTAAVIRDIAGTEVADAAYRATFARSYAVAGRDWHLRFPVEISAELHNKAYCLDLRSVEVEPRLAQSSGRGVLEAYLGFRAAGCGGTEVDCSWVAVDGRPPADGRGVFMLTPPLRAPAHERRELVQWGLEAMKNGRLGPALIGEADWRDADAADVEAWPLVEGQLMVVAQQAEAAPAKQALARLIPGHRVGVDTCSGS